MPSRKLHVLIIPSWYPHHETDVRGRFFQEHAKAMEKKGCQVGVIYPQLDSLSKPSNVWQTHYGFQHNQNKQVPVLKHQQINWFPKLPSLTSTWWLYLGKKLLARYITQYGKPDVIHACSIFDAGFLAAYAQKTYQIPYVLSEHSSAFARNLLSDSQLQAACHVVDAAQYACAVSPKFVARLDKKLPKKSPWQLMPDMVAQSFFDAPLSSLNTMVFRFAMICGLNANKSVDLAIKAFIAFHEQFPNSQLVIGGDGQQRDYLRELVKESSAKYAIHFLGVLTQEQVIQTIQNAHALLQTSQYETFSIIVAEAQALGKPVISTLCEGPESIITPDSGILVEKNNVAALKDAMVHLVNHYDDFKPEAIRASCQARFGEEAITAKWLSCYQEHACV